MTKILYIPFGVYIRLPKPGLITFTEVYEETFAINNGLDTAQNCIEYMCQYPFHWFLPDDKLPGDYYATIDEFEVIYD